MERVVTKCGCKSHAKRSRNCHVSLTSHIRSRSRNILAFCSCRVGLRRPVHKLQNECAVKNVITVV